MKPGPQSKLPKPLLRTARNERDRARKLLGPASYRALVEPFVPHLRAAMQRHDCEALVAARFVIDSLKDIGCEIGVQRLVAYAAADIQFPAAVEVAA